MKWLESRIYMNVIKLTDYILLSLLWTIGCLPVITIFTSTTAMFKVIRRWKEDGKNGILRQFFGEFKRNFSQKLFLNVFFVVFFIVVEKDLKVILSIHSSAPSMILPIVIMSVLIVCGLFVHLFNVYSQTEKRNTFALLKNTLLLTVGQIPFTILGVLFLAISIISVYIFPFLVFIIGSFLASMLMKISDSAMKRLGMERQTTILEKG